MKKRIIVFDDEELIVTMIKEILEEDPALEVAHGSSQEQEFMAFALNHPFDLALMDISIGGQEGGLNVLKALIGKNPKTRVIMLSAHDEVTYALKCLHAGASGYINKCQIVPQLLPGIEEVLRGGRFISGSNAKYLLDQFRKETSP